MTNGRAVSAWTLEAKQKCGNDDHSSWRKEFSENPGYEQDGYESNCGCEYCECDRYSHSLCPLDRVLHTVHLLKASKKTSPPTTMASSTTIPSTRMNANSEIRLIVILNNGITKNVPRKETGIPILTHIAREGLRNSVRITSTSANPTIPLLISILRRPSR